MPGDEEWKTKPEWPALRVACHPERPSSMQSGAPNEREGSPPKTHKALATASESDRRSFALNMRAWWHTWSGALDDTLCAVEGHAAMTRCAWAKGMLAMTGRAHHRMASSSFALASVHARVRACQQCGSSGSARRMKTVE